MDAYFHHLAGKLEQYRRNGDGKTSMLGELKTLDFWRASLAEFLATTLFVFIGCASTIDWNGAFPPNIVRIAFTFGLGIAAMIQAVGHVSGGHINPAVSVAMALSMNISPIKALFYVISQVAGGICGAAILFGITPPGARGGLGVNNINPAMTPAQGFAMELILTFILVIVIYGTTDGNRVGYGSVSLSIGLTVTLAHLAAIPYSGASMNPARSLGPAVVMRNFENHWIYWVGPLAGGVLASLIYKFVISPYRGIKSVDQAVRDMLAEQRDLPIPPDFQIVVSPGLAINGTGSSKNDSGTFRQTGSTNQAFEMSAKTE